jgi:RNA polymerase sigma factor (sigma-70 family)
MVHDAEITEVVTAAAAGDQRAWAELVRRYSGLVLSTARAFRLLPEDIEDVSQMTWLLLATHIRALHDPRAIAGWLATTARREGIKLARRRRHDYALDDVDLDTEDRETPAPDERILRDELLARVRRGFAALPERCQRLLRLLLQDPPMKYRDVSAALGVPPGSIGPNRARCLDQLRRIAGLSEY